jgi:hypothetical protein
MLREGPIHPKRVMPRTRPGGTVAAAHGNELLKLQKRLLRARDTMAIERGGDRWPRSRRR